MRESDVMRVVSLVMSKTCDDERVSIDKIIFFFNDTATTEIYTLSLHDALPILIRNGWFQWFSVWELKVPMVPYLEIGWFQSFLV